jgi:hypothetical protein
MLSRLRPGAARIAAAVTAGHGRRTAVPLQLLRDGRRTHAGCPKLFNLLNIDGRLAPLIDAVRLRGLNAFELAFAPEVRFEFSEDAKHVEEGFARSA